MRWRQGGTGGDQRGTAYQLNRLIGDVENSDGDADGSCQQLLFQNCRIFRDICRVQKKDVEFVASCGDIEADKSVVEYVFEARCTSFANGQTTEIETPAERVRLPARKNPERLCLYRGRVLSVN